ncbi:hypothetical protein FKM82_027593 [Ascaphus truei]
MKNGNALLKGNGGGVCLFVLNGFRIRSVLPIPVCAHKQDVIKHWSINRRRENIERKNNRLICNRQHRNLVIQILSEGFSVIVMGGGGEGGSGTEFHTFNITCHSPRPLETVHSERRLDYTHLDQNQNMKQLLLNKLKRV